jgi:hypothetical protein
MSTATVLSPSVTVNVTPIEPNTNKEEFRNYVDSAFQDRVSRFYFEASNEFLAFLLFQQNHVNQTLSFVLQKKEEILKLSKRKMSLLDAIG